MTSVPAEPIIEAYNLVTPQRRLHLARLKKLREARVADAAWHYNRQYPTHQVARCLELGFTRDEIEEGFDLGEDMLREYHANVAVFGDPCYGRWGVFGKPPEQPIRTKIAIWLSGPACAACGELADTVAMRRELGEVDAVCCGGKR
jgi:hypothetical protein